MLGWVSAATLRKDLPGNHLVMNLEFGCGMIQLVELDRGRALLIVSGAVLARDRMLARFMLAGDDGRVGGQYERRQGLF
jgi:hypothetical protein